MIQHMEPWQRSSDVEASPDAGRVEPCWRPLADRSGLALRLKKIREMADALAALVQESIR